MKQVTIENALTVFVPPEEPIPEYPKDEENDEILFHQLKRSVKLTEKRRDDAA